MGQDEHLFATPRRRRGPVEHRLSRTLAAWRSLGHLTGDEHAATRGNLADLARNIDRAIAERSDGDTTGYALTVILRTYDDLLARHAPPPTSTLDAEIASFLDADA